MTRRSSLVWAVVLCVVTASYGRAEERGTPGRANSPSLNRVVRQTWDFYGTTEMPKSGTIACGYFVTTILRDAGSRLERARLAQRASEHIIKSLTSEAFIRRFSNVPLTDFVDAIEGWGPGIYVVGLDCHTGFIINDSGKVFFVHSSYVHPQKVLKEPALASRILRESRYRVLGKITDDDRLIVSWLAGTHIATKTQ